MHASNRQSAEFQTQTYRALGGEFIAAAGELPAVSPQNAPRQGEDRRLDVVRVHDGD